MFDPGSKFSYILTSIVKELKLNLGMVYNLDVGRFGTTDTMLVETYEVLVPVFNLQGSKRTLRLLSTDLNTHN